MFERKTRNKIREKKFELSHALKILVELKMLPKKRAIQILKDDRDLRDNPISILARYQLKHPLIENHVLTHEGLSEFFAGYFEIPYVKLDPLKIEVQSVNTIVSEAYAKRLRILPILVGKSEVTFATCSPHTDHWIGEMESILKRKVKVVFANPIAINKFIVEFFSVHRFLKGSDFSHKKSTRMMRSGNINELEKLVEHSKNRSLGTEDSATVKIVTWIVQYAYTERASDIHFEPKKGLCKIRFRIDGILLTVYKMDPKIFVPVVSRLKILCGMKVDEKRKPQDGRIKGHHFDVNDLDLRLSSVPTLFGEKLVIRVFNPEVAKRDFLQLGFYPQDKNIWTKLINANNGIILVTGPTGSGKTTTLYTSLEARATDDVNICTIEDPVEMINDKFNQLQINKNINLNFSGAIRAFLRQDPDIIMVGEIRDTETGEMAAQASLTGHLVFSTLHTNGALSTITRLLDLGIAPYLLNATLRGILAQRLVRKLCPHCKKKEKTPQELWNLLVGDDLEGIVPEYVYKHVGCTKCKNTGYLGRLCIYELLVINQETRKLITPDIELSTLEAKTANSFTRMNVNAARRVIEGITDIDEVLKVV